MVVAEEKAELIPDPVRGGTLSGNIGHTRSFASFLLFVNSMGNNCLFLTELCSHSSLSFHEDSLGSSWDCVGFILYFYMP